MFIASNGVIIGIGCRPLQVRFSRIGVVLPLRHPGLPGGTGVATLFPGAMLWARNPQVLDVRQVSIDVAGLVRIARSIVPPVTFVFVEQLIQID